MSWTLLAAVPAGADKPAGAPTTQPAAKAPTTRPAKSPASQPATAPADGPCVAPTTAPTTKPAGGQIKRFALGSPFGGEYKPPKETGGKRIWAYSCLWEKAPKLEVEKWLSREPKTEGKFVLIEFWATWCPPCRKSIGLLNGLHKKFGKDLVVIGISHEAEADVRALKAPKIEYFSAIDTKARTKKVLGVFGIPHVIMIEPGGSVVWEGFPLLKGHELTEKIVAKMIEIGRKSGSLK
ncbi:MAG: redoxin domain-containing protein [Phycisphaerae bacterium]|nr:redoxin domain-containing protein [Phycisphaerae bacterium]